MHTECAQMLLETLVHVATSCHWTLEKAATAPKTGLFRPASAAMETFHGSPCVRVAIHQ
jgi:hypothetical protein